MDKFPLRNSVSSLLFSLTLIAGAANFDAHAAVGNPNQPQKAAPELLSAVRSASTAISAAAGTAVNKPPHLSAALRSRAITVDLAALRNVGEQLASDVTQTQTIQLGFFDDAPMAIEIFRVEPTSSGGRAYIGRVPGEPFSTAVLIDNPDAQLFNVTTMAKKFTVTGTPAKGYFAAELVDPNLPDHSRDPPEYHFPSTKAADKTAGKSSILQAQPQLVAADTGATIDVMVIYTNTARVQHGGVAQTNAAVDAQIVLTNQIYLDSNVVQRLRLVYKGEVTHVESSSDTDLDRVIDPSDGFLDAVPVLRNLYQADIVSLWGNYPDTCGLGSLMSSESDNFASRAYNVVNSPSCTNGNSATFAHELGHNMGLNHDLYVSPGTTSVTPEAGGAAVTIGYAHGYVDVTNRFRTVMSYPDQCAQQVPTFSCLRIGRFSNPNLSFNNSAFYASAVPAPTGNAATAHERQALNDTRETTANFRQGLATFTGPGSFLFLPPNVSVAEGAGLVTLTVERHLGSTGAVSVNYATSNGTATAGSDYTATSGTLSWADGEIGPKSFTVNISQDGILEGRETFTATLSGTTGGAAIAAATATVAILDDDPDTFPAGGVVPSDYAQVTPTLPWSVNFNDGYLSTTSLQSAQVISVDQVNFVNSDLDYTGNFVAGNINFAYRVSSYSTFYGVLEFYVDGALRFTSAGGETGWLTRTEPITAGNHTLRWRFKNRLTFPCANAFIPAPGGSNCADRAWIDGVVLPLSGNTLSIVKAGSGTGTVTGTGINCGPDCVQTAVAGTMITLTAVPSADSTFAGWSGAGCSGTGTCAVTLSSSQIVTATFNLTPDTFPANCVAPAGFTTPAGATSGWSVAFDRKRSGICSMKSNVIPDSVFNGAANATKAQIQVSGTYDAGNISFYYNVSSELGYDCLRFSIDGSTRAEMGNCNGPGSNGGFGASGDITTWTLVPIPVNAGVHTFLWSYEKDNSVFAGADAAWLDDVTLPPAPAVLLTVAKAGSGAGTVTGTGINCGVDCTESVPGGTIVALTAAASVGSTFTGWSGGGCSGTGNCNVTVSGATTVTATFTLQQFNLSVSPAGIGGGTVTSAPAGINCGATCTAAYNFGATVTLTATAAGGSSFGGWNGSGCSGTGTCVITISAAATVTATFNVVQTAPGAPTLNSAVAGNAQATLNFTAPMSNGGSPITGYNATCGGVPGNAAFSPIVVSPLVNNMSYACTVTATNAIGTSVASNSLMVTPVPGAALALAAVFSRKNHPGIGDQDITIDTGQLLNGLVTVEPRTIGAGHRIVFRFNNTVTSVTSSTSTLGSTSHAINGSNTNEVIVTLTGIADNRRTTVSLTGVNGVLSPVASMGFLVGDVNNSRSVNVSDISAVKARNGQMISSSNFRYDVNVTGNFNGNDVSTVKARSGLVLP